MTDQIDALRTELNIERNNARLWLKRYTTAQRKTEEQKRELYEYSKALQEWQAAYDALLLDFNRLQHKHVTLQYDYRFAREMEEHFRDVAQMFIARVIETTPDRNIFADEMEPA